MLDVLDGNLQTAFSSEVLQTYIAALNVAAEKGMEEDQVDFVQLETFHALLDEVLHELVPSTLDVTIADASDAAGDAAEHEEYYEDFAITHTSERRIFLQMVNPSAYFKAITKADCNRADQYALDAHAQFQQEKMNGHSSSLPRSRGAVGAGMYDDAALLGSINGEKDDDELIGENTFDDADVVALERAHAALIVAATLRREYLGAEIALRELVSDGLILPITMLPPVQAMYQELANTSTATSMLPERIAVLNQPLPEHITAYCTQYVEVFADQYTISAANVTPPHELPLKAIEIRDAYFGNVSSAEHADSAGDEDEDDVDGPPMCTDIANHQPERLQPQATSGTGSVNWNERAHRAFEMWACLINAVAAKRLVLRTIQQQLQEEPQRQQQHQQQYQPHRVAAKKVFCMECGTERGQGEPA
jgi:hypothetical protein